MTKEQARIYFLNSLDDDLFEVWEQHFFDEKQYFLTKAPIDRVWRSRLVRLQKKYNAFLVLTDQETPTITINTEEQSLAFPSKFIDGFNEYYQLRNQYKAKVFQAMDFHQLEEAVMNWLEMEKIYQNYWLTETALEDEVGSIRSMEIDPMQFLTELKAIKEELGIEEMDELKNHFNNLSELVRKEVKRLTLLAKDLEK